MDELIVERQHLVESITFSKQPEEKASLLLELAWLEFTFGNFTEAEACIASLLKIYPNEVAGLSTLFSISCHSGDYKRAVDIVKQILSIEDKTDTKFILAHALIKIGGIANLLEAYYIARNALADAPSSVTGWFILSFVYHTLKLRQKAVEAAEKGLASDIIDSQHAVYQIEECLLKIYLSLHIIHDKKIGLFYAHETLSIMKQSPREIPISHCLRVADYLEKLGDTSSSLNLYESVMNNNIRMVAPSLARFYLRHGMFRKAISLMRNYLFLPPTTEETKRLTQIVERMNVLKRRKNLH